MKILFGFVILLCTIIPAAYHYPKIMSNEPDGFRGIPWHATAVEGSSSSDRNWGLVDSRLGEFSSCKVYERKNEELCIGDAVIDSVFYSFEEEMGFVSATIYFEGIKNFELISKQCMEQWGRPSSEKKQAEESGALNFAEFSWRGKRAETTMWYSGNSNLGALHIYLKKSYAVAKEDFNQIVRKADSLLGQSLD